MGFLNNIKDKTTAFAIKKYLNSAFSEYGEVIDLSIDTSSKTIFLKMLLNGEKESVMVNLQYYSLSERNDGTYLKFGNIDTSREWVNAVIRNFMPADIKNSGIKLPAEYTGLIKSIL